MKTLFQQEKLFHAMFESSQEGILLTDAEGCILRINPAGEQLFGYTTDELTGKPVEALIPSRMHDAHRAHRATYRRRPHVRRMGTAMDLSARRKDGTEFFVEAGLSYLHLEGKLLVMVFLIDVTERKRTTDALRDSRAQLARSAGELEQRVEQRTRALAQANAELRKSQTLYRAIARHFPNGLISVVDADNRLMFLDGQALNDLKLRREEWLNRTLFDHLPADTVETSRAFLDKVRGGQTATMEVVWQERCFVLNATPLPGDDGSVLVVGENVTELKKAEQEMRHALKKERELNELKTRFVSMASHEFRTPLSTILSSTSLVDRYRKADHPDADVRIDKHLRRIKSSVNDLVGVLDDFLSIGKIEEGHVQAQPTPLDVADLLQVAAEEMQTVARRGQRITIETATAPPEGLLLDRKLLKHVLNNLLSNAIKYSAEGDPIRLRLDYTAGALTIDVIDVGLGIPEAEQRYLFNRFFRADNVAHIKGTGLGLYIVKRYVELMGGKLRYRSRQGEGTTFTVRLSAEEASGQIL
ncbi:MAG: PAS domain S-box protein [Catalinimonas sp.]